MLLDGLPIPQRPNHEFEWSTLRRTNIRTMESPAPTR